MAKAKSATPQSKPSKKTVKAKQAAVKAETKKPVVKVRCSLGMPRPALMAQQHRNSKLRVGIGRKQHQRGGVIV